ncbi:MAG: plasmid mobilization protein [Methylobacter sp.]
MIERTTKQTQSGSETRKRQGTIKMRVDSAEKTEVQNRAARSGLSVSGFLRALVFGKDAPQLSTARRPTLEMAMLGGLRFELRKIGGHLQQIVDHLKQGKDFDDHAFNVIYAEYNAILKMIYQAVGQDKAS